MLRLTTWRAFQQPLHNLPSILFIGKIGQKQTWANTRLYTTTQGDSENKKHDILFFGTDEFASNHLKALILERDQPGSSIGNIELVCPPDRLTGRKMNELTPSKTKALATLYDIPVHHTPVKEKTLDNWQVPGKFDLGVVVSFGYFIPPHVIETFKKGAVNVHPSLLPKYRGAAPIQHTILGGDEVTGVTVQELDDKAFDAGRILSQEKVDLSDEVAPAYPSLLNKLSDVGCKLLVSTLRKLDYHKKNAKIQDPTKITSAPKIKKDWADIKFDVMTAWQIEQLHRAIGSQYPIKTIFTFSRFKRSKKLKQRFVTMSLHNVFLPLDSPAYYYNPPLEPGTFVFDENSGSVHVCCADGNVIGFTHIQAESKKTILAKDFVNGYEIRNNVGQFGELSEEDVEAGMSGVRVTKKRAEYNKVIRKRLRMRKVDFERLVLNKR